MEVEICTSNLWLPAEMSVLSKHEHRIVSCQHSAGCQTRARAKGGSQ
ncbi:unnamed protein product [Chondrus crispus]|uniref:Uncharacterized protein n=1 Tax=Chondrus crispus TaxID=2769 RepID=R7Q4E3_CHOCR|nr:unnamed protein product [Chondrus crispus]CDF32226.1 unnamed protein product [Chondrus crispus]|eukprot:XP_005711891.1 unnamed protein product [Chondrus crispus]